MLDVEFLEGWGLLGGGDPVGQVRVFLAQLVECVVDLQGAVAADPETVGPCEGVAPETFCLSFPVGWIGDDFLVDGVAVLFGQVGEPDTDPIGDLLLQTEQLPTGETDLVADAVVIDSPRCAAPPWPCTRSGRWRRWGTGPQAPVRHARRALDRSPRRRSFVVA